MVLVGAASDDGRLGIQSGTCREPLCHCRSQKTNVEPTVILARRRALVTKPKGSTACPRGLSTDDRLVVATSDLRRQGRNPVLFEQLDF